MSVRGVGQAVTVLLGLAFAATGHAQVDEHALKAAFVYNIAAFAQSAHAHASTLTICTQTGDALAAAIGTLGGRDLAGRRVSVVRVAAATGLLKVRDLSAASDAETSGNLSTTTWTFEVIGY